MSTNGNKIAGHRSPGIVIALKRNGAYAGDIQVQQLGLASCLKVGVNRRTKLLIQRLRRSEKKYG